MNEAVIQTLLGRHLFDQGHGHICGNFQTTTLPECDLISVNRKGLLCEWEIKISKSDFKADAKKQFKHTCLSSGQGLVARRRGGLVQHLFLTCSYFSYACPPGLIYASEVPAYAGLVWVYSTGKVEVQRAAPLVHAHPADSLILGRITHNLTQKYLYGCSRTTFANRGEEPPKILPTPEPIRVAAAAPPPKVPLHAEPPAPQQKGRRVKVRDPRALRRR